jgi:hypothetical protein
VLCAPGEDRLACQPNECVGVEPFARSIGVHERITNSQVSRLGSLAKLYWGHPRVPRTHTLGGQSCDLNVLKV